MEDSGEAVPMFTSLKNVYGQEDGSAAESRYSKLREKFQQKYGHEPELYARAPGGFLNLMTNLTFFLQNFTGERMTIKNRSFEILVSSHTYLRI
jgi:hypothetical protein